MSITWSIVQLDRHPTQDDLEDVVFCAHWRAEKVDGDHSGMSYGSVSLDEVDPDNFTTYEDITEDDAILWVKTKLGVEEVASIESNIEQQITESKTPSTMHGLPWA